ncbi:hypothetical protein GQ44DRAFT_764273 [Phaeosphaeriaceae sp. PMI808]|nr:hypothetical protein GQ44DRAFT_764273 [Phaeosphaeriaceae sp. PMI808]
METHFTDALSLGPHKTLGIPLSTDHATRGGPSAKGIVENHLDRAAETPLGAHKHNKNGQIQKNKYTLNDRPERSGYESPSGRNDRGERKRTQTIILDQEESEESVLYSTRPRGNTARSKREERIFAIVSKLVDAMEEPEEKKQGSSEGDVALMAPGFELDNRIPDLIEEEIKKRNRTYAELKINARSQSRDYTKEKRVEVSKKEMLYAVPVEQLNLQVMNPQQNNPCVDIVAVHGLGAIPDITWKEKTSGINWLSHEAMLPSAAPQARILSLQTLTQSGCEESGRSSTAINIHRPLLWGLVIQRALNLAKMQQSAYPGVFDSSIGIVFLGTPHRGTQSFAQDSALFAAIAASSDLSQNLEPGVLSSLTSDNGTLLDVTDDFVRLCVDRGPIITCFFEQRPSTLGKIVGRNDISEFIVDQRSATLDGYHKYGLESDHFSLNKFNSPDNPNYIQVRAEILRFYNAAVDKVERLSNHDLISSIASSRPTSIVASKENYQASYQATRLSRRPGSLDLRHKSPQSTKSTKRHSRLSWTSTSKAVPSEDEGEIRKEAMKELEEEEAKKQKVLHEEQTQKQRQEEKDAAERQYIQRLRRNMARYGIDEPNEILASCTIPQDKELSQQEIKDKEKWYKNLVKRRLFTMGLTGGQVDEILNDTGDLMLIDDVEISFTKMAKIWISTRTLDKYEIPWQNDEEDDSAIIIKRWVPDYERDFLWDHSQALRESRDRKSSRDHHRAGKLPKHSQDGSQLSVVQERDCTVRRTSSVKSRQKRAHRTPMENERPTKEYLEGSRRSDRYEAQNSSEGTRRSDGRRRDINRRERALKTVQETSDGALDGDRAHYSPRTMDRVHTPPQDLRLKASHDTTRSAPDIQEVARRRLNSRTLDKWQGGFSSEQLQ